MTTVANEDKIRQYIDKSDIQELRYCYWYAILDKEVDALVELFTDDVCLEYGFGIELRGKKEVRDFFNQLLGSPELVSQVPRGANGIIQFTGENSASGRWMVEALSIREGQDIASLSSVQYFEEYARVDGQWKIARMKNDYLYFESVQLRDGP